MIGRNRVVITGIGVLAANGIGKDAFWNSLLAGESGIGPITLCDVENLPSKIAGEVKGFDVNDYTPYKIKAKRLSRNTQFAVAASLMALKDSGIDLQKFKPKAPLALALGISMAGFDFIETEIRRIVAKGNQSMLPTVVGCIHIASASSVADILGFPCTISVFSNSCVGGIDAIAKTYADLRDGKADVALAGGSDAPIETSLLAGFCAARMLCTEYDSPETASRPFDLKRSLGILAEGAAIVLMETLDHALDRGAEPLAEIIGYGTASDATEEPASGLECSMRNAMANACIAPSQVGYISAHAPSDLVIDRVETNVIKKVLGEHAYKIPISSIKGSTGNPLAAGGAMQVAATVIALRSGILPPTANLDIRDPDCDLNYVEVATTYSNRNTALVNSHGIGRVNSSLVLQRAVCQ